MFCKKHLREVAVGKCGGDVVGRVQDLELSEEEQLLIINLSLIHISEPTRPY